MKGVSRTGCGPGRQPAAFFVTVKPALHLNRPLLCVKQTVQRVDRAYSVTHTHTHTHASIISLGTQIEGGRPVSLHRGIEKVSAVFSTTVIRSRRTVGIPEAAVGRASARKGPTILVVRRVMDRCAVVIELKKHARIDRSSEEIRVPGTERVLSLLFSFPPKQPTNHPPACDSIH